MNFMKIMLQYCNFLPVLDYSLFLGDRSGSWRLWLNAINSHCHQPSCAYFAHSNHAWSDTWFLWQDSDAGMSGCELRTLHCTVVPEWGGTGTRATLQVRFKFRFFSGINSHQLGRWGTYGPYFRKTSFSANVTKKNVTSDKRIISV